MKSARPSNGVTSIRDTTFSHTDVSGTQITAVIPGTLCSLAAVNPSRKSCQSCSAYAVHM